MSKPREQATEVEAEKRRRATGAFPKNTLKEALQLAQAIQDNNGGDPYNRLDLASAINTTPESSKYRTLITSSSRYVLTEGSYQAEQIALTDLGRSIVAPRTESEKNSALARSLRSIELFNKFFERFDQAKLPRDDLLKNTLIRDFGIPSPDSESCLTILKKNLTDFGILVNMGGNNWVRLDKLSGPTGVGTAVEGAEIVSGDEKSEPGFEPPDFGSEGKLPPQPRIVQPKVFISHSKNQTILDQIKEILKFGQFDYIVAEETDTTSIPIPDRVFGAMRQCNSAMISMSADEKEKNPDGSYRVNPNVLIEIGGAFLAYNKRVILLADRRVAIPSNLQGLYRVEYEGEEISFNAAMGLQKALATFRKID